jgi:hypothetical protein
MPNSVEYVVTFYGVIAAGPDVEWCLVDRCQADAIVGGCLSYLLLLG